MVHETKLLTFWRALNAQLFARGERGVDLETANTLMDTCSPAEAADLLAPAREASAIDAGLYGWDRQFNEVFGG
jgi:hypothetical protein